MDLIGAEYNPRKITMQQLDALKDSIRRFGVVDPVIINVNPDRKNIIIGGHQRVRAAKEMGQDTVPCVELDLSLEQERELNIRLNKNTGTWDFETLLENFDEQELLEYGFEPDELALEEDEGFEQELDDEEGVSKEDLILKYDLIFDTEDQMAKWNSFVVHLDEIYRGNESVAEKIITFVEDHDGLA
jgi:ParB-like chromosome segregation protein Spo0J